MGRPRLFVGKYPKIAARLSKTREQAGMSQVKFAAKLGVSLSSLKHLETGRYVPTYKVLIKWHKAFKVSYDWILEGKTNT